VNRDGWSLYQNRPTPPIDGSGARAVASCAGPRVPSARIGVYERGPITSSAPTLICGSASDSAAGLK
jgi:hypothetical protein